MNGPRLRTTWLLLIVIAPLPCPDRAFTSWAWTVRLTCTHRLANRGPVTILWTWVWTNPFTAPAICPEKLFRRSPTRVSPRCVSAFAAPVVQLGPLVGQLAGFGVGRLGGTRLGAAALGGLDAAAIGRMCGVASGRCCVATGRLTRPRRGAPPAPAVLVGHGHLRHLRRWAGTACAWA